MKLAYMVATPEVARMPISWVGDPAYMLPRLGEMGYEGVEIQVRDPAAFDTVAYEKRVRAAGMTIAAVSSGQIGESENLYLTSPEPERRRGAIERYKKVLELAAQYGVDASIGRFRGLVKWAPDRATGLRWFHDAVAELLPVAEKLGVRIVLEPQHGFNTDFLNTFTETLAFIAEFNSKSLVFEADVHHVGLVERSIPGALVDAMRSGLMTYVQVSDSNRLPPGMGHFNWVDILDTLRALGYDGWIAVECKQVPDSERCAAYSFTFLDGLLRGPE